VFFCEFFLLFGFVCPLWEFFFADGGVEDFSCLACECRINKGADVGFFSFSVRQVEIEVEFLVWFFYVNALKVEDDVECLREVSFFEASSKLFENGENVLFFHKFLLP